MRFGSLLLIISLAYLLVGCQFMERRFYVTEGKINNNQVNIKISDRFDYSACLDKTLINAADVAIKNNHNYFSLISTKQIGTTSSSHLTYEVMPGPGNGHMFANKTVVCPGFLESTIQFSDKKESIKYFEPYKIKENLEKTYKFNNIHKSEAYLQSRENLILNSYFSEVSLLQDNVYLAKCTAIPSAFTNGLYAVGIKAVELAKSKNFKYIRALDDNMFSDDYFQYAEILPIKVSKKKNHIKS